MKYEHKGTGMRMIYGLMLIGLAVAAVLLAPAPAQAMYRDGMNLYQYVRSNPVNRLDARGLDSRTDADKALDAEIERNARGHAQAAYDLLYVEHASSPAPVFAELKEADKSWFDKRHSCGPNITENLKKTVRDIEADFNNSTPDRKCKLCYSVFNYGSKVKEAAWDITPLYAMSPGTRGETLEPGEDMLRAKGWARSVQVGDRCYDAAAVNYLMYGVMGKLCKGYDGIKEWEDILEAGATMEDDSLWARTKH